MNDAQEVSKAMKTTKKITAALCLWLALLSPLTACDDAEPQGGGDSAGESGAASGATMDGGGVVAGEQPGGVGVMGGEIAGVTGGGMESPEQGLSCRYENLFSGAVECKDYSGSGWTEELASDECAGQQSASFSQERCSRAEILGVCYIDEGAEREVAITFPGESAGACQLTATGCVRFARGRFEPSELCEGQFTPVEPPVEEIGAIFEPFELLCVPPADGQPGLSEGEEVCTWRAIGGCTEPGRSFKDYASCEPVLTQRPYAPAPASGYETPADDPIREDPAFIEEVEWVRSEAQACGCVCCHAESEAPRGAAVWDTDKEGLWTDDFTGRGLAMAAGWLDTSVLGAFPAAENNGFDRSLTALPSTDPARMIAFFEGELARRGYTRDDFDAESPIGGPLYSQRVFEPSDCANGEGVSATGELSWVGGEARYVYVLRAGSDNPSTPPNLDLPEGTLWRVDVDFTDPPIADGLIYGAALTGARQAFPVSGSPEALVEGERYYLYVLRDIGQPITRCLFTLGAEAPTPGELTPPWGDVCAEDSDCGGPTDYCVKMPGAPEGYCSRHCDSLAACSDAGAPNSWSCNALNCDVEALTWCGPVSEIEESGGFLNSCP